MVLTERIIAIKALVDESVQLSPYWRSVPFVPQEKTAAMFRELRKREEGRLRQARYSLARKLKRCGGWRKRGPKVEFVPQTQHEAVAMLRRVEYRHLLARKDFDERVELQEALEVVSGALLRILLEMAMESAQAFARMAEAA